MFSLLTGYTQWFMDRGMSFIHNEGPRKIRIAPMTQYNYIQGENTAVVVAVRGSKERWLYLTYSLQYGRVNEGFENHVTIVSAGVSQGVPRTLFHVAIDGTDKPVASVAGVRFEVCNVFDPELSPPDNRAAGMMEIGISSDGTPACELPLYAGPLDEPRQQSMSTASNGDRNIFAAWQGQ